MAAAARGAFIATPFVDQAGRDCQALSGSTKKYTTIRSRVGRSGRNGEIFRMGRVRTGEMCGYCVTTVGKRNRAGSPCGKPSPGRENNGSVSVITAQRYGE